MNEYVGLVPDDDYPCGYKYCPVGCMMTDCAKFGQVEKCRNQSLATKVNQDE